MFVKYTLEREVMIMIKATYTICSHVRTDIQEFYHYFAILKTKHRVYSFSDLATDT